MDRKAVHCFTALLALHLLFLSFGIGWSEDGSKPSFSVKSCFFNEIGLITGIGYGEISEGDYIPVPIIVHLGTNMKRWFPSLEGNRGELSLYIEPQGVLAFNSETNVEAGIALGIKYRYPFNKTLSGYVLGSVGVQYITLQTEEQSNGYLFADTIGAGFNIFVLPDVALDFGYRFRHLSNADLAYPNGGIDNHLLMVGVSFFR